MRFTQLSCLCAAVVAMSVSTSALAEQKLFVYTSMKETMIGKIKTAFAAKYPDIKLDAQSAGAGKLMAKIAAERESGKILADVLWTSEVPDFYQMKAQGLLLQQRAVRLSGRDPDPHRPGRSAQPRHGPPPVVLGQGEGVRGQRTCRW